MVNTNKNTNLFCFFQMYINLYTGMALTGYIGQDVLTAFTTSAALAAIHLSSACMYVGVHMGVWVCWGACMSVCIWVCGCVG